MSKYLVLGLVIIVIVAGAVAFVLLQKPPEAVEKVQEYGVLMGKITDTDEAALGGVSVSVSGKTVIANEGGWFSIDNVPASDRALVTFSKEDYVTGYKVTSIIGGESNFLSAVLSQVGTTQSIDAASGGTVTHNGGSITIEANSLVDSAGNPFTGEAQVSLTTFDPSDEAQRQAFPGNYAGLVEGTEVPFESFGFMDVSVTGGGEPLELATGKTAAIEIPIPSDAVDRAPENIDLWYYDTTDGYWKIGGTATKVERTHSPEIRVYLGRAWLFLTWNADRRFDSSLANAWAGVRGSPLIPLANARVIADGVDYYGISEEISGPDGRARVPARPNSTVKIWATYGGLSSNVLTVTTPSAGEEIDVGELIFDTLPGTRIVLTWGENPRDLDSHIAGTIAGENIRVYYASKGSLVSAPYIYLDTDDRSSYGPEIITFGTGAGSGTYRYSVDHYSGIGSIENSGAVVNLIAGGKIRRFTPPPGQPTGTRLWRVFDITIDSAGNVTDVGTINDYVAKEEAAFYP